MASWLKKNRLNIGIFLILILGFLIRTYFVNKVIVGDLLSYVEWGKRLFQTGPKNFYFSEGWYYSVPNYPPFAQWVFAGLSWLNDKRYILAQMHNVVRFPPAAFIIYFYQWGDVFMIKLLPILCDLGLSVIIYKLIFKLTKDVKKSIAGLCFFLFNPLTIFISGAWGQTDSVVSLLGLLSFLALINKKVILSIPLMFLSLYFKLSWAVLAPFYIYLLFSQKPKVAHIIIGSALALILFVLTTGPFANGNIFYYAWNLMRNRYPITLGITGKASISAFNFQTIFFRTDIDFSYQKLLGVAAGHWGMFLYAIANLVAIFNFRKQKNKLLGMISGVFIVGMGSFLFLPTMLERYFSPALPPMIILAFAKPKLLLTLIIMNLILIANIIYSFYRRGSDEIYHFFIDNSYLLTRVVSVVQVLLFATFVRTLVLCSKNSSLHPQTKVV
jgi:Gpi18-like mannosyltransferase